MNEQVIDWLDIGRLDDIPVQGSRRFPLDSTTVAVFRTSSDDIYAIEDSCPHAGGPLSEGIVHGHCVTCPLHNWVISLKDGAAQGSDEGQVKRYGVKLQGKRLLISSKATGGVTDHPSGSLLVDA